MKKILVYGDSFSAGLPTAGPGWIDILSATIQVPATNMAVSGGSTEYAMKKFQESVQNNNINDGDIIIFQPSTPGRLYLEFQATRPETASQYLHEVDERNPAHSWYKDNKKFIQWYMVNYDNHVNQINYESYIHVMKNFAESNPNILVIVLQHTFQNIKFPMSNLPGNFLMPNIELNRIAEQEIVNFQSYDEWVRYSKIDLRRNHLSIPNLQTLANLVKDVILNKTVSDFTYDKFLTNIFETVKTAQDYNRYVEQGYLYNNHPSKLFD